MSKDAPSEKVERTPYKVRGGFTLHLGKRVYRADEIVDLTAAEADLRRHQVEAAPDQADPNQGDKKGAGGRKPKGGDNGG